MSAVVDILHGAVASGSPTLFVALGELLGQRAGVINLGQEGAMLAGALTGFAVASSSGNVWLGALCGAVAGCLITSLHAFLVLVRHANQLASGLAITFFGMGVTSLLGRSLVGQQIGGFNPISIPGLSSIPIVGSLLFSYDPLAYIAALCTVLTGLFLYRTRSGLLLRAVGEGENVVFAAGHRPIVIRFITVAAGGLLSGLGGVELSTAYTHSWVEDMTSGAGFIAVSLVIFASWIPWRAMVGAYLFGGTEVLQMTLQTLGLQVSPYLLFMAPYVLTLTVLVVSSRSTRSRMPAELSAVFGRKGGG